MSAYDPDDLDDGAMSLWCDGDDVYAIPFSTSPFIMIYNADLFAEAGLKDPNEYVAEGTWTWETFRECMKAIKDKTGVYGYMTVNNAGYSDRTEMNLTPFVRGFGGDFWTDDLEVLIDSPESIAAVQMFHDMVYVDGSVVPPGDESNFFTGGAACTFNQISQLGNLADVTWKWGVSKLPGRCVLPGPGGHGCQCRQRQRRSGCRAGVLHDQRKLRRPRGPVLAALPQIRAGKQGVPQFQRLPYPRADEGHRGQLCALQPRHVQQHQFPHHRHRDRNRV